MNPGQGPLRVRLRALALTAGVFIAWGCQDDHLLQPDPQNVRVYFKYGFRDAVDTFSGTLTKDLRAGGTITVPFWLTSQAQDSILAEAVRDGFFGMPDTMPPPPGLAIEPDPGPQILRIQIGGVSHQAVWYISSGTLETARLAGVIRGLVTSTAQYRSLPPAHGGYM